jgi:proteasome accessory factor C
VSRFTAGQRVERLLAIIPWLHARDGASIDEIVARFDYPRSHLVDDLESVVNFVGVYPFTPDSLLAVSVERDQVRVEYAPVFTRPLRLRPDEALSVLAAGKAMLAASELDAGASALFRAVSKLSASMGKDVDDVLEIRLGTGLESTLGVLRTALGGLHPVEIDYYSYSSDSSRVRVVEPHRCFVEAGQWYLEGRCRSAGAVRVFRVDRIRTATVLEETFAAPEQLGEPELFVAADADALPRVDLRLSAGAEWVAEQYPHDSVDRDTDGRLVVRLPIAGQAWLERLLVRLGPDAEVVGANVALGGAARRQAAQRILARYAP